MSPLTFEALSQFDQLNNQRGLSSPPASQDRWETASDCSYYSLSELVLDKWYRQIPASQVREQAKQITGSPMSHNSIYPWRFHNKEELALQSSGPWQEYPFCLNKGYVSGSPGPVRIITNSAVPGDFDVVYHPGRLEKSACRAKYRSKGYQKGAVPKPLPTSEPSSPSTSSSSVCSPSLQYNPYIAAHLAQYQQAMPASYFMQSQVMPYAFPSPALAYSYFPTYGQY